MVREINNSMDIFDSRDVIDRIRELEDAQQNAQLSIQELEEDGDSADNEEERKAMLKAAVAEDGTKTLYGDFDEETYDELKARRALSEKARSSPDWHYGESLIRDSYFRDYARELAEDIGAINRDAIWPLNCLDWEEVAEQLKEDYMEVDYDGVTYWIRA